MPRYSKNPIPISVTTTAANEAVEVEVFIEKVNTPDNFTSLGTFTFTSNASSLVFTQINSILDAAMAAEIVGSIPDGKTDAQLVPEASRKYYYRHRHYDDGAWTSWTEEEEEFVLLGGQPYEEYTDGFAASAATGPTILSPETALLACTIAAGWVYVLIQAAGEVDYEFTHYNTDGDADGTVTGNITTTRAYQVIRIPIALPTTDQSAFFGLSVTADSVTRNASLMVNNSSQLTTNDFTYLNSRGGWSFLPCYANLSRSLDVSQNTAEVGPDASYYEANDVSQYKIWKTEGRKKFKTATGFLPQDHLDVVLQDFMLSPLRFIWNADLQKWIPVIVTSKSAEYRDDLGGNLRSFAFEFQYLFDNNLPSAQ
jgi:hypothetical protein